MGSHPVILNGKGAAAVMVAAWASWLPAVSVVWELAEGLAAARRPGSAAALSRQPRDLPERDCV